MNAITPVPDTEAARQGVREVTIAEVPQSPSATPWTLAGRLDDARAKLAAARTTGEVWYYQGALAALEAYSAGAPMPEIIGQKA